MEVLARSIPMQLLKETCRINKEYKIQTMYCLYVISSDADMAVRSSVSLIIPQGNIIANEYVIKNVIDFSLNTALLLFRSKICHSLQDPP